MPALDAHAQLPENYFRLTYEWEAGSIPPQWHSQFRIMIQTPGPSEIVMIPGYPDVYSGEPRWRISLSPTKAQMDSLLKFIEDYHLFGNAWTIRPRGCVPPTPTGGSRCTLSIAKSIKGSLVANILPCNDEEVEGAYKEQKDTFVKMIREMVPAGDWDQLEASMKKYLNEATKR